VVHFVPRDSEATRIRAEAEVQAQVAAAMKAAGVGSLLTALPEVREADSAAQAILSAAEQEEVDLLVLGTHGRTALGRALIGSVSSHVARHTEVPVLLVPPV
jgi:nucleotide-binding universal stress UspA family protein